MTQSPTHLRSVRLRADLTLLLVAVIWGSAFVAQRVAAQSMGAYLFNGVRFLVGALVLLPLAIWNKPGRFTYKNAPVVILAGGLMFAGASTQQLGLRFTTAGNAGFITGLYVVLIPLIQVFFLRRRSRKIVWLASLLAAAGLFLLSTGGQFRLAPGDALELISAFLWALHVLWIGRAVKQVNVLHLVIGQNIICGVLSLVVGLAWEGSTLTTAIQGWWPILYTGVLSIGVGYTLQAVGQKVAPAADAAIILSLEAVFAALGGWLLLNERLTPVQLMGSGLMFSGMVISQIPSESAPEGTSRNEAGQP
jgi:drug/metabolite transporter (DMT)-like permease